MCDENQFKNTSKTAFSILTVHFPDPGHKLKTVEFLEASSGVVSVVGKYKIVIKKAYLCNLFNDIICIDVKCQLNL